MPRTTYNWIALPLRHVSARARSRILAATLKRRDRGAARCWPLAEFIVGAVQSSFIIIVQSKSKKETEKACFHFGNCLRAVVVVFNHNTPVRFVNRLKACEKARQGHSASLARADLASPPAFATPCCVRVKPGGGPGGVGGRPHSTSTCPGLALWRKPPPGHAACPGSRSRERCSSTKTARCRTWKLPVGVERAHTGNRAKFRDGESHAN